MNEKRDFKYEFGKYLTIILGIFQTQPISASCVLGNNKIICILTDNYQENYMSNEYDVPKNFNIIIDGEETSFKNFTKKNLENFAYKLFE